MDQTREPGSSDVSRLIHRIREGDEAAPDALIELVYHDLRAVAGSMFRGGSAAHSLQPTALVHEAWLKLAGNLGGLDGRTHFMALAARAMRQVLADHAKAATREKRGGACRTISLASDPAGSDAEPVDLVALDDCLTRLGGISERMARIVEFRLLGGMTIPEIAAVLGVSPRTIDTDWSFARAWLRRELLGERG